jgi:hypothetical protein
MRSAGPLTLAGALAFAGCATGPGHGFGEITEVTLDLGFTPGEARDLGDGGFLTDLGYRVHLDRFEVGLTELRLEQLPGAGGGLAFDPADPPAGYTLCHNGHCHAEDGSLHSYEEVEAEATSGAASWTPVVAYDLDREVDLLGDGLETLPDCEQDCALPQVHVQRVSLDVRSVSLQATIHDDDAGTTEWAAAIEADATSSLLGTLNLPFDRDHDPVVRLDLTATVDGTLLDTVDPGALLPGGGDLELPSAQAVTACLDATLLEVGVERQPYGPETEPDP